MSKVYCSIYNGIGNQLFAYATGLYVSKMTGSELYADLTKLNLINFLSFLKLKKDTPRKYELPMLGFDNPVRHFHPLEFTRKLKTSKGNYVADFRKNKRWTGNVPQGQDIYTVGWCDFSQVKEILPEMRSRFDARFEITSNMAESLKIIQGTNSVAIHVRRTDYLHQKIGRRFDGICTDNYYQSAIRHIRETIDNPYFIIFSDDMEYVKNNLQIENSHFVAGNPGYADLYLMSACRHFIVANSTFSFWAAILNSRPDKVVCVPEYWYNNPLETEDFIPPEWVKIPVHSTVSD